MADNLTPKKSVNSQSQIPENTNFNQEIADFVQIQPLTSLLVQHSPNAIAIFDCKMCYIAVSQRWYHDYHLEGKNIIGKSHYDVFPETAEVWKYRHQLSLGGTVQKGDEDCLVGDNGQIEWFKWEIHPWFQSDRSPGGIVIFTEIITKGKRLEQHLCIQYALAQILGQSHSLEEAGYQLLQAICLNLSWDLGELWVYNPQTNCLEYSTNWHKPIEGLSEFILHTQQLQFTMGEGLPGKCWLLGEAIWLDDIFADTFSFRRSTAQKVGLRSGLAFPIICDRQVIAVITLFSQVQRFQDSYLLAIMANAGKQLGQFVERQEINTKYQQYQQLLRFIIDNIPQSIFWKDRNGVYLGCNRNFAEDAGIDRPEYIIGKTDYDLPWTKKEADFFREWDRRVMEVGVPELHIQESQLQANGKHSWVHTSKIPLRDVEGNVIGILGCYEDITDRKEAETALKNLNQLLEAKFDERTQELRQTEMRLSRLADNVPGMLYQFRLDPDGNMSFPYVSSGCRNIYELEPQEVQANSDTTSELVHTDDIQQLQQTIIYSAQNLTTWEHEWRIITASGKQKWLKGISKPELQTDNSILWSGCIIDITELKQTEIALHQLNEQLETKVEERTAEIEKIQTRLAQIADNVPGMIYQFRLDTDGNMSLPYISSGCEEIYEVEADEIQENIKQGITNIHPEDLLEFENTIAQSAQTLEKWQLEHRIITPSGQLKWVKGVSQPQLQPDNSIIWDGCVIDITSQKQTEAQLLESQQRLQTVISSSPIILFALDKDGKFTFSEGQGLEALGLKPGEVVGASVYEIYRDYPEMLTQVDRVFAGEEVTINAFEIQDIYFETRFSPVRNQLGQVIGITGVSVDITERKRAENKLREQKELLRSIYDGVDMLIFVVNVGENGIFRFAGWNYPTVKATGLTSEDVMNKSPQEVFGEAQGEEMHQLYQSCIQAGKAITYEECRNFDGTDTWWLTTINPLKDSHGNFYRLIGTTFNITERKQAEMQLEKQKQDLQSTLTELQRTQSQLIQSEKMSSLGQMVAGIAHEINNPANFIHGNLTYASDYAQDLLELIALYQEHYPQPESEIQEKIEAIDLSFVREDLHKLLDSMSEGTKRIREIVLSLRNFSRLDEAEFKLVDIHEGLESTLLILHNRLKSKPDRPEITVIKNYTKVPKVECYPGQLNQVFMNILANAIDAIETIENPCITINTQIISQDKLEIQIIDNGMGIPVDIIPKLFDPFFTTKEVGKGTGLGLSISYQIIVDKHKGRLSCQSQPGQGTKFIIEIPISHN